MQRRLQQSSSSSSGSSRATGSGSVSDTVVLPTASSLPAVDSSDPCLWDAGMECGVPRSCFDCLNAPTTRGQCMVDPAGRCVSLSSYNYTSDFRVANKPSSTLDYFPSTNTSYCDSKDATCAACRSRLDATGWYYSSAVRGNASQAFCVGQGGCVCVATCDAPAWNETVLAVCATRTRVVYAHQNTIYMGVMVATSALCAFIFFFSSRWTHRHPFVTESEDVHVHTPPRRRRNHRQLDLPGWNLMREKLIEEERCVASTPTSLDSSQAIDGVTTERSAADAA